jgi:hypothetical protein
MVFLGCSFTYLFGNWEGKTCAIAYMITVLGTYIFNSGERTSIDINILLIDILCFFIFVFISLKSNKNWTIWLSGLQLSEVLAHFPGIILTDYTSHTYEALQGFWAIPTLFVMALGIFFERLDGDERFVDYKKD